MRRGNRCADIGRKVDPKRGTDQRGHHGPHKDLAVFYRFRVDNSLGDGRNHITTCQKCACAFAHSGNRNRATHGQCVRANGGAHIVCDVIRTNVDRHIGTNSSGSSDDQGTFGAPEPDNGNKKRQKNEGKGNTEADHRAGHVIGRHFKLTNPIKIAVQCFPLAA